MATCPKCNYYIRDNDLYDEPGEDHFIDGCPKCGYKPTHQEEE